MILFFSSHHDEKNTIEGEVKMIEAFRAEVKDKCVCVYYNNNIEFDEVLQHELSNPIDELTEER